MLVEKPEPIPSGLAVDVARQIVDRYESHLPRRSSTGTFLLLTLSVVSGVCTVLSFPLLLNPEWLTRLQSWFGSWLGHGAATAAVSETRFQDVYLVLLSVLSISWALYRTVSTPRRASEEAYFSHLAIHVARDFVALKEPTDLDETNAINRILHTAEKSFTFITKRKCVASIKWVMADGNVQVKFTSDTVIYPLGAQRAHPMASFSSIADITSEDKRFYMCNDVWMDFRNGRYEHPLLAPHKEKGAIRLLWSILREYLHPPAEPLHFRSTLVVPIRHYVGLRTDMTDDKLPSSPYFYFGFLCIDCKSRKPFKPRVITEIAATYADAICTVFIAKRKKPQDGPRNRNAGNTAGRRKSSTVLPG